MTTAKARKSPRRAGYLLDIYDPHTGKRTSRGLGTADEGEAESIARDYSTIGQRQHLITTPLNHIQELSTFHVKAVELHLGRNHPVVCQNSADAE